MDAFYSSQFDDQSPSFFTLSQAYDHDQPAYFADQVSTHVGNAGLPASAAGFYGVSNMDLSSSLPADVNHGAEMFPQASHFPPHAVADPYASAGFASQPVLTQQHFVPPVGSQPGYDHQHGYTQQALALQPDYDPDPNYDPQHGYTQHALALQSDYNPQPNYDPQHDYTRQALALQPGYNPQPGYDPQHGYTQHALALQSDYNHQPDYNPQPSYDHQHGYTQQALALQPDYSPQHGHAQQVFAPQPGYNPPQGYNHPQYIPPQQPVPPQQAFALQQGHNHPQGYDHPQGHNPPQGYNHPQYIPPQQPTFPQYHPALQQPMAPHGFAEDTGTPHQPVSFQPNLAPQPLDVHPQFAPQAAATAAVPAPVPEVPQVLADPPVDESSDSDPEGVGAPFLFEANVWLNKTRRSLGLRSWNEMKDALSKEDIKNLENLAGQFNKGHWVESLRRMSKEDFKTYYLIKRELCKQHNKPPPRLPAWVKKYVFGNDKLQDYTLITPHYAATMAL